MERDVSLPFTPKTHDVRLARDRWVYYVRGVKRSEPLDGGIGLGDASLFGVAVWSLSTLVGRLVWRFQKAWKVGVVRFVDNGRVMPASVVHEERLTAGVAPDARISELVADVQSGRFDTTGP
jgi:hypothetical protein